MIPIGEHQELTILRHTAPGLYLGDEEGEDVLLPNKYCPSTFEIGDKLKVFVYRDFAERKVATNLEPKILLYQFAYLKVTALSDVGAFLDWGLEKDLIVPFSEQRQRMEQGKWYIVSLELDKQSDRLYATSKIERLLQNEKLTCEEGDAVDVLIMKKTDLGFSVIVNQQHEGLIFESDVLGKIEVGEQLTGYVKRIREENKLDISLQPIGFENYNDPNCKMILAQLAKHNGFLPTTDKSSPAEIYEYFGISKKAYKKAVGTLYKERKILLTDDGVKLV